MEDNKLMAEFMGVEKENGLYLFTTPMDDYKTDTLYFDISWDWLMPVVEKILDISFQDEGDAEDFYSIRDCIPDINHTHKALIEFIKGYNNLNK